MMTMMMYIWSHPKDHDGFLTTPVMHTTQYAFSYLAVLELP